MRLERRTRQRPIGTVQWRLHGAGRGWLDEVGCDEDDELSFVAPVSCRFEQLAKHWHIAEIGELVDILLAVALKQACDREGLPARYLDGRVGTTNLQGRYFDALDFDRARAREAAHLRTDTHRDPLSREQRRREEQRDTKGLELDANHVLVDWNRHRNFATSEEARGLAGHCGNVGLGEDGHDAVLLQRLEQYPNIDGRGANTDHRLVGTGHNRCASIGKRAGHQAECEGT